MNTIPRIVIAAALLAALSACGNKGALVQASSVQPDAVAADPALDADPAAEAVQVEEQMDESEPVAAPEADPAVPVQEDEPVPAQDDGTP